MSAVNPNVRLTITAIATVADTCPRLAESHRDAGVAERIGSGLQSRVHGFESRHSLQMCCVHAGYR